MTRVLGIDPGLTGGAAIWDTYTRRVIDAIELPTVGEDAKRRIHVPVFFRWMRGHEPDHAFVERAQAMPDQGSSSGFIYGRAVGALEATCACYGIPLHVIESAAWKKFYRLPGGAAQKEQARQLAIKVAPCAEPFMPLKKHHGRAEAVLIAMWGADRIPTRGFFNAG